MSEVSRGEDFLMAIRKMTCTQRIHQPQGAGPVRESGAADPVVHARISGDLTDRRTASSIKVRCGRLDSVDRVLTDSLRHAAVDEAGKFRRVLHVALLESFDLEPRLLD